MSLTVRNPRGGMLGLGNIGSEFRNLFSKDNLTIAGGGVAATVVTQYLLNSRKTDGTPLLPMPKDAQMAQAATVAYAIGIPFAGALAVRRFSPGLSKGMLLGGLINGIIAAWQQYGKESYQSAIGLGKKTAATSMYLDGVGRTAAGYMPTNNPRRVRSMGVSLEGRAFDVGGDGRAF